MLLIHHSSHESVTLGMDLAEFLSELFLLLAPKKM